MASCDALILINIHFLKDVCFRKLDSYNLSMKNNVCCNIRFADIFIYSDFDGLYLEKLF